MSSTRSKDAAAQRAKSTNSSSVASSNAAASTTATTAATTATTTITTTTSTVKTRSSDRVKAAAKDAQTSGASGATSSSTSKASAEGRESEKNTKENRADARGNGDVPGPPEVEEPTPTDADKNRCSLCGAGESTDDFMICCFCRSTFHARCANLPQTPEEGDVFCRWVCCTNYRKQQDAPVPVMPLGDFPRIAARVQTILSEQPRRSTRSLNSNTMEKEREEFDEYGRPRSDRKRVLQPANGRSSRSSSPFRPGDGSEYNGFGEHGDVRTLGGRTGDRLLQGRVPSPHVDLTGESPPPPSGRGVSPHARSSRGMPYDAMDDRGHKRHKYAPSATDQPPHGRGVSPRSARELGSHRSGHFGAQLPAIFDPSSGRAAGAPLVASASITDPYDGPTRLMSARGRRYDGHDVDSDFAAGRPVPPAVIGEYEDLPSATVAVDESPRGPVGGSAVPPAALHGDAVYIETNGRNGMPGLPPPGIVAPPQLPPSSARGPSSKANIPWLNPTAFPAGLYERFNCQPDHANGVFRIDLTPVFADKAMHLFQSEIDFFFRCFESADVSLVVRGLASELNQYIWAWPFLLESCGSETHFSFDHFQFRHGTKPGELPELEYVGELRLSMAAYNTYLERYLSSTSTATSGSAKDVVVLEDHVTKRPITLVASENIIVLNELAIGEHCTQLYNDLIKSFQWDVFAGGIHCVLQYLAAASRPKRFASPRLHFNFPGARSRLCDPGNGTTDHAYQVLVGSVEIVIFERLEPNHRDEFRHVLRRVGYDADKKDMLLDTHLRALRDAGFVWSTVVLHDGDFVHINKGRMHFWRVVEPEVVRGPVTSPCVFLSWEWVFQGVSQRGISTECWFAMKNASLCSSGWAFDPRRAVVEAGKCGVSIVRTGQFLNSLASPSAPPVLLQLAFTGTPSSIDRDVVTQRQEQMVLFLESILPCLDAIVEEEFELGLIKDDSDVFRKMFDDEVMWKVVDTSLSRHDDVRDMRQYTCGICSLELTNIYKQCLGCTVHAHRSRPNMEYKVFRICLRCHAQPERHHFKPRRLHGYYDKMCSSEGHTGLLPATRRYQSERSYFKCRCMPYVRCSYCGGCESCCCLCHTLFQTRFRYASPEQLDHLRSDVVDVIKWHKQHR